jgi:1-aminocyclopropane-1-carboxylate deaminase/D-cysteine desulfhydrase-like pyridoxal-dependent ACC family enzyme
LYILITACQTGKKFEISFAFHLPVPFSLMLLLFEKYPLLKEKLPYRSLGEFPTPIERLDRLGQALNTPNLYTKREDLSGMLYGGNKVRALEFLLGDALQAGDKQVMAAGFPASCHALAQAIYARQLGVKTLAILFPQVNSEQGRRHLLVYQSIGADVRALGLPTLFQLVKYRLQHGHFPKFLEASSPLGMAGYVNAGLELKGQIEQGLLPEPDLLYVGLATMGTAVGLALGCKAADLKTRVVSVHLGNPRATPKNMAKLFRETNELLHSYDPSFPTFEVTENDFDVRYGFERPKGRLINKAGEKAMKQVKELSNLQLDEMFTANTFAVLIADAEKGLLRDKTVLWWNSYSSIDLSDQVAKADYRQLPKAFHRYFQ